MEKKKKKGEQLYINMTNSFRFYLKPEMLSSFNLQQKIQEHYLSLYTFNNTQIKHVYAAVLWKAVP